MVDRKDKRTSKGKKGGKKTTVDPFTGKESSDFISHEDTLMVSAATIAQSPAKPVKQGKIDGEKEISVEVRAKKNKRKVLEAVKNPDGRKKPKKSKEPEISGSRDLTECEEEVSVAAFIRTPAKPAKNGKSDGEEKIDVDVCMRKNKREVVKAFKKSEDRKQSKKQKPETSSSEDLTQSEEEFTVAAITRSPRKLLKKGKRDGVGKIKVEASMKKNTREVVEAVKKLEDEKKLKKPQEPETSTSEDLTEYEGEVAPATIIQPRAEPIKKRKRGGEEKINVEGSTKKNKREIVVAVKKLEDGKKSKKPKQPETNGSEELMESEVEDKYVKMEDAPSTNANGKLTSSKFEEVESQTSGSKTLFVGNLSFEVGRAQVEEFFKKVGEIIQVRLATTTDGYFKGYGHVVFATEGAAQKALQMNGEELLGHAVKLELAQERGPQTSVSGEESVSGQRGGDGQSKTVSIKGFDTSLNQDQVHKLLKEHFGSCGDVSRLSVPKEFATGALKGIAFMDFEDQAGITDALNLNGSNLGGYILTVDRASMQSESDGHGVPPRWTRDRKPCWDFSSLYRQHASIPSKGKKTIFEDDG